MYKEEEQEQEYAIIYFDFDNIWATLLDATNSVSKYNIKDDENLKNIQKDLQKSLEDFLNKILEYLTEKYSVKYIKAYSDFNSLLFSEHVNIVDTLHKYGIKTYTPYVRNNKDMSDRALIIAAIHDVMSKEPEIMEPKLILFTGDIDYLPLFEYISEYTDCEFEIFSFENRLSQGYSEVFYTKNKITKIDELLGINTKELEEAKKLQIFKEYVQEKNLDINKHIDYQRTIRNLNREYYCRFNQNSIKSYIQKLK
jgi:hypothetical protein